MIKKAVKSILRNCGYEIHKVEGIPQKNGTRKITCAIIPEPPALDPVCPFLGGGVVYPTTQSGGNREVHMVALCIRF